MALRQIAKAVSRTGARSYGGHGHVAAAADLTPASTLTTAANGLRIASITTPGETATVTAWVDAGSRYESASNNGVANLFETAALASKAAEIAALGGMVTSYTSREFIVFEAKVTKDNVVAATKLLGALVSSAPTNVDGAKGTMLCALSAAAAAPDEVLMEHLHDAAYLDTPMGMSVLGTPETVAKLGAADVAAFAAKNVTARRTVVAAAGAVDGKAFAEAAAAAFGGMPAGASGKKGDVGEAMAPATFTGSDKRLRFDSFPAAHVAVVFEGASHGSEDWVAQQVMGAYLGSFDTSSDSILPKNKTSRLASDQGEQQAATAVKVISASYKDSGLFGLYFSAPDNRVEDGMWYSLWNLVRLVHKTSDADVAHAKVALKASLATAASTSGGLAADLAKQVSTVGRAVSLKEMFARIDAVDAAAVKAVAKKVVNDQDHALAAAGPIYELPDYTWIRRRSYWLRY